jgi:hypothetical protein
LGLKGGSRRALKVRGKGGWTWPVAALVAASVSAWEAINTDDQPSLVVFDANCRVLSLTRRLHLRKPSCREAPARPIHALREGADTRLSALLLGSKNHQRFFRRVGATPFLMSAPKILSGLLSMPPVEMLLDDKF